MQAIQKITEQTRGTWCTYVTHWTTDRIRRQPLHARVRARFSKELAPQGRLG